MRVILSAGKKVYFTLLASSFMFPVSAFAQCVDTQDCQTLGYTETSNSGNCVKCFFGNYWACPGKTSEKEPEKPEEPEGAVLGQCTGYAKNCKIGDILYTDGTCSADVISAKTPIAVVVYIGENSCGQALALEKLGAFYWSTEYVDIPDLQNYTSDPLNDFSSCENTNAVNDYSFKQHGDNEYYQAFWAVYNYAPSSMPETKGKWCLPAGGVLNSITQNKTAINQSLTRINKEIIDNGSYWWSSSEFSGKRAWFWFSFSGIFNYLDNTKLGTHDIRPVIEF